MKQSTPFQKKFEAFLRDTQPDMYIAYQFVSEDQQKELVKAAEKGLRKFAFKSGDSQVATIVEGHIRGGH
mgnify:CR=1|tara:strand:+ start:2829 stop:3038 length:210 start_codon:yes stop_codon:yes gene_type:complete